MKTMEIELKRPTCEIVDEYLKKWDKDEKYSSQEEAVNLLFKHFPKNQDICHILVKVAALNDFYSIQKEFLFQVL